MKKQMIKIMPLYSWVMVAVILTVNYFVYFSTRPFTAGLKHYSMVSSLDRNLPFISIFFSIYLLAYIQWIIGFVLIGKEEQVASRMFVGELIAKGIARICFVFFPTTIEELRPSEESLRGAESGANWQHVLIDVIGGLAAVEIGLFSQADFSLEG